MTLLLLYHCFTDASSRRIHMRWYVAYQGGRKYFSIFGGLLLQAISMRRTGVIMESGLPRSAIYTADRLGGGRGTLLMRSGGS